MNTLETRLTQRLRELRESGSKAMGIFLTCGFPEPDASLPLLRAIDRGGADFIELGMPFSDPLAEGVPIQRSSAVALANGTTLATVLGTARAFRSSSETPLLLMGYVNPIYRYGTQAFCRDAAAAGVDGLILPDLPPEAAAPLRSATAENGLDLIFLIAPNTPPERITVIDRLATGFVYAVAFAGLTGDAIDTGDPLQAYLSGARAHISNPLLVGFGVKTRDDARRASLNTDGFIVGSALINHVEAIWQDEARSAEARLEAVESFVRSLRPDDEN